MMVGQSISHYKLVEKLGEGRSRPRFCEPLLFPIPELFVPVLDDADLGGNRFFITAFDRGDHHESLAVGRDVVCR